MILVLEAKKELVTSRSGGEVRWSIDVVFGERLEDLAGDPEMVQEHGELSGEGDESFLFSPSSGQIERPMLKGTWFSRVDHAVGCLDQQSSHFGVTLFGDSPVVTDICGSAEGRSQAEEGCDITTSLEAIGVVDGKDEVQGDDGADSGDGLEVLYDRVGRSDGLEAVIEILDFRGDLFDLIQQGLNDGSEIVRHLDLGASFVETARAASWHSKAKAAENSSGRMHPLRPSIHQRGTCCHQPTLQLSRFASMGDASEKSFVYPDESREYLGVDLVCFHRAFGNQADATRRTDDDVVPQRLDQPRDPG